jgi:hypothetical protein
LSLLRQYGNGKNQHNFGNSENNSPEAGNSFQKEIFWGKMRNVGGPLYYR